MSKIDEAKQILKELGLPTAQQNEISAYTLLALCGIKPRASHNRACSAINILSAVLPEGCTAHRADTNCYGLPNRVISRIAAMLTLANGSLEN